MAVLPRKGPPAESGKRGIRMVARVIARDSRYGRIAAKTANTPPTVSYAT